MTISALVSFTVKVTTPLAFEGPLAAEMVELPVPWVNVTALPLAGLLFASSKVTVMFEVAEPSAAIDAGLALTVDLAALAAPAVNATWAVCVTWIESVASVAV